MMANTNTRYCDINKRLETWDPPLCSLLTCYKSQINHKGLSTVGRCRDIAYIAGLHLLCFMIIRCEGVSMKLSTKRPN
ncbi:hypothetical protein KIN20_022331 [Parelaphostrongylus tenuis]|uniref:Uncharacterized protein n=1 Tax=Parelaphostrongylus tenuis TaxID=148309 RepID=A0AAD5QVA1_PARTN|nr:hypothetical protein KIN20_022331 [Parelaphostrongylus tenuis]